jgi:hypothetical protein
MPSPAFSIRPCLPSDAAALCALGARLFRQSYGESHPEPALTPYLARVFDVARVTAELKTPDYRAWFAVDAGQQPVGYAVLRRSHQPRSCGSTSTGHGTAGGSGMP